MLTSTSEQAIHTLEITKDEEIAASIDIVFETLLEQLGPLSEMPDGAPLPLRLEPWPGGRWYRDLGNRTGHLWGHIQVIKPPMLLEIYGPLIMSYPAISHLQYRLTEGGGVTRLKFVHRAIGLITSDHREGIPLGWSHTLRKVREGAERRAGAPRANR